MAESPALHPLCEPLASLLGTWAGAGHGEYPTIEPFDYDEVVTFGHAGKPFLSYTQRTVLHATGLPGHAESGYLRAIGDGVYELVVSSPTGIVELDDVTAQYGDGTLVLHARSTDVVRTPTAKSVTELTRRLVVRGDVLDYEVSMAAVGLPLTHHLAASLRRQA